METHYYLTIEGIICLIISLIVLFNFIQKNTNPIVLFLVIINWFLNIYMIILLPYDIFLSKNISQDENTSSIIKIFYFIIYWCTFLSSWIFIPLLQNYEKCGYFSKKAKIIYSIKSNLIYYGILILIIIILLIWAKLKLDEKTMSFFFKNMFNFSYLYGLLFLLILLGYGIVKLPKNLYEKINMSTAIKCLESDAKHIKDNLAEVKNELANSLDVLSSLISDIKISKEMQSSGDINNPKIDIKKQEISKYYTQLQNISNFFEKNSKFFDLPAKKSYFPENPIKDLSDLANLNKDIKKYKMDILRLQCQLTTTYNKWAIYKTILIKGKKYSFLFFNFNSTKSRKLSENNSENSLESSLVKGKFNPITNISTAKIIFYKKIRPSLYFFFTLLFLFIGIIIIISELTFALPWNISILGLVINSVNNVLLLHIVVIIPILILFLMSMYTLLKFKIAGYFGMYNNRQTDSVSILFFTSNLCSIVYPLCLNILLMINKSADKGNKQTILETYFGINIKNQVFSNFSKYMPLLLIIFVFITLISNYCQWTRIKKFLKDDDISDTDEGREYLMKLNREYLGEYMINKINLK